MFNLIKFLKRKYKENEIKEMERILRELDELSLVLKIKDEKGRYIFHPDSFACSNLDHEPKVYTELRCIWMLSTSSISVDSILHPWASSDSGSHLLKPRSPCTLTRHISIHLTIY